MSKIFNNDSGIYYNLGITYEKLKNPDKAQEAYIKAISLAPEEVDAEVLPPDGDPKVPAGVAMIGHVDEADQDLEAEEAS